MTETGRTRPFFLVSYSVFDICIRTRLNSDSHEEVLYWGKTLPNKDEYILRDSNSKPLFKDDGVLTTQPQRGRTRL